MSHIALDVGRYDPACRTLEGPEGPIRLTPKEAALLEYLAAHPRTPLSHAVLLREVWGYAPGVRSRTVYTTIDRLRAKIERDPTRPRHILSLPTTGYRFEPLASGLAAALVGREDDLARLEAAALQGRLVTVVGTGGVGKTSLARAWLDPGGTLCELASARTAADVVAAVAAALGLPVPDGDPIPPLGRALASGTERVVFDNVEQLSGEARAVLLRWRELAAGICLVATSREPLGAQDEVIRLEPLDASGSGSPAVSLLRQRSSEARAGLPLPEGDEDALVELAQRLDGLPLAIELVAARTRTLSIRQILARLADRFRLLGADASRGERQETLEACIDWSWGLLDEPERRALARCSIFVGSFSLEAAEAVLEPVVGPNGAPDLLGALVDRSLLQARSDGPQVRFDLLQSVRAFVDARLTEPERRDAEAHHGAHFARWGAPEELEALDRHGGIALGAERGAALPDLVAATRRALARGDRATAAAAGLVSVKLLSSRGPLGLALELAEALRADPCPARRIEILFASARIATSGGRLDEAELHYTGLLESGRAEGDLGRRARALDGLGLVGIYRGEIDRAAAAVEEALPLHRATRDRAGLAEALERLGSIRDLQGDPEAALACLDESLVLYRALGDRMAEGTVRSAIARVLLRSGQPEAALHALRRSLALHREIGNRRIEAVDLVNLTAALSVLRRLPEAIEAVQEAIALYGALGNPRFEAIALNNLGGLLLEFGRFEEAEDAFLRGLAIHREFGNRRAEGLLCVNLGERYYRAGRALEARTACEEALERLDPSTERVDWLSARSGWALAHAALGQPREAIAELRLAIEADGACASAVLALAALAEILLSDGALDDAATVLAEGFARLSTERESDRHDLLSVRCELSYERGDLDAADRDLGELERIMEESQSRSERPLLLALRGASALARGERERAAEALAEAEREADEMGLAPPRLRRRLEALRRALPGRPPVV